MSESTPYTDQNIEAFDVQIKELLGEVLIEILLVSTIA